MVANPTIESIKLAKRITEFSAKYAAGGQLGIVLNKVENQDLDSVFKKISESELEVLGSIPFDKNLHNGTSDWKSETVKEAVKQFYFRLNLPQENS